MNAVEYRVASPAGPGGCWPVVEFTGTPLAITRLMRRYFSTLFAIDWDIVRVLPIPGSYNLLWQVELDVAPLDGESIIEAIVAVARLAEPGETT